MKGLDWIRVVSNIAFDDDLEHVSDADFRTFIELVGISAFDLTDGRVALARALKLCNTRYVRRSLDGLSASGHVQLDGDSVVIPNYSKYQQTREEVEKARAAVTERVTRYRSGGNNAKSKSKNSTPIVPTDGDGKKTRVVKKTYTPESPEMFARFWQTYPNKLDKQRGIKAWNEALSRADANTIVNGLTQSLPALLASVSEPRYLPYPATWLNGSRWEDDFTKPRRESDVPLFTSESFDDWYDQ